MIKNIALLAADYQGWHFWQSDAGTLYATRDGGSVGLSDAALGLGFAATVSGATVEELRAELAAQATLDASLPAKPVAQGSPRNALAAGGAGSPPMPAVSEATS